VTRRCAGPRRSVHDHQTSVSEEHPRLPARRPPLRRRGRRSRAGIGSDRAVLDRRPMSVQHLNGKQLAVLAAHSIRAANRVYWGPGPHSTPPQDDKVNINSAGRPTRPFAFSVTSKGSSSFSNNAVPHLLAAGALHGPLNYSSCRPHSWRPAAGRPRTFARPRRNPGPGPKPKGGAPPRHPNRGASYRSSLRAAVCGVGRPQLIGIDAPTAASRTPGWHSSASASAGTRACAATAGCPLKRRSIRAGITSP